MSRITEATAQDLIEVGRELTIALKGLTLVLLEDRDADHAHESEPLAVEPPRTYMDGSTVGS